MDSIIPVKRSFPRFSANTGIKLLLLIFLLNTTYFTWLNAQKTQVYKPTVSRVLFVLDGSGSMKQKYDKTSKFETAKQLLFKLIDSVENKNPNVEFAVRVFGSQAPSNMRNCKDSKLIIPFAKNNASHIISGLDKVVPQGMSPIAYSIQLGAGDFPDDPHALNSIVLITDGEETCGGDPCKVAKELLAKKISLKPFIIGLNVDSSAYEKFKCMGTFFNTHDEASFYNTIGVIIKQTLNTTTAQVNLIDANGNPSVTNIPFTLYDHYTGKIEYNFVHTMNEKGNPDTLFLDPVGIYDLELHTTPSIRKENIELVAGKHNIIALDVPEAELNILCNSASGINDAQVLVRPNDGQLHILNVQDFNTSSTYLKGSYKCEILTTPEVFKDTSLEAFTNNDYRVSDYGTLSVIPNDVFIGSIYRDVKGQLQLVERVEIAAKNDSYKLQPGKYYIVYKAKKYYHSESTHTQQFTIDESRTTVLTLQ